MADKDKKNLTKPDDAANVDQYIPTPPDGGYGWVIVVASFFNHIIVDGIAFTFGVFYEDFLGYFEAGSGKTALVGSLLSGFYLITAPVAGSLVNKFGCRFVGMLGAFVATIGFVLCIFSTSIDAMMLTYGVIGGIGLGLLYLPNVIAVSYYFQKRRALATGIAVCGSGVGCFVFAPLGEYLLITYSWKSAMLIMAGITLHGCLFSSLLRPLEPKIKPPRKPRAKNCFDRCCESIGFCKKQDESKDHAVTVEKVNYAKLVREQQLRRDSERAADFNSANKLSLEKVPLKSEDSGMVSPETENMEFSVTETDLNSCATSPSADCEKLLQDKEAASESLAEKAKKELQGPSSVQHGDNGNLRCVSDLCLASPNGKLPESIDKTDLSKPLYRRDIFYSGSMLHVAEFQSQPNMTQAEYTRSVTAIPVEQQEDYKLCRCIPVSKSVHNTAKQMTDLSLLKNPLFFIPCLTNLCGAVGLFIPFVYIAKRAVDLNVSSQNAAFLLSVIGITNTLGRLVAGALADYKWVNALLLHNMGLVCAGILCILHMFCNTYVAMCLFAAAFGLCIATWISLTSIVLCNMLGLEQLTNAFGLLTMTRGIATFIGTPMAGFVYDATKDYNNCFQVGGIMLLLGGLLCCTLHLPYFTRQVKKPIGNSANQSKNDLKRPANENGLDEKVAEVPNV